MSFAKKGAGPPVVGSVAGGMFMNGGASVRVRATRASCNSTSGHVQCLTFVKQPSTSAVSILRCVVVVECDRLSCCWSIFKFKCACAKRAVRLNLRASCRSSLLGFTVLLDVFYIAVYKW